MASITREYIKSNANNGDNHAYTSHAKTTSYPYMDQISTNNDEPDVKRLNGIPSSKYLFPINLFLYLYITSHVLISASTCYTIHAKQEATIIPPILTIPESSLMMITISQVIIA